jgi:hypothetical protein
MHLHVLDAVLQVAPQILHWVEIRTLRRPLHDRNAMLLEPLTREGTGMARSVILLEDEGWMGMQLQMRKKTLLKNGGVLFRTEGSNNTT